MFVFHPHENYIEYSFFTYNSRFLNKSTRSILWKFPSFYQLVLKSRRAIWTSLQPKADDFGIVVDSARRKLETNSIIKWMKDDDNQMKTRYVNFWNFKMEIFEKEWECCSTICCAWHVMLSGESLIYWYHSGSYSLINRVTSFEANKLRSEQWINLLRNWRY